MNPKKQSFPWYRTWFCLLLYLGYLPILACALSVDGLRCEYRIDPEGIDVLQPRLSWVLQSESRGEKQTAYQVLAASSENALAVGLGDLWDSGKVPTNRSIHVVYAGRALLSRQRVHWKIRVWDKNGEATSWSPSANWTMGLLSPIEWQAKWIANAQNGTNVQIRGPLNGYHSQFASLAKTEKWVTIDLGEPRALDSVRCFPARPYDWQPDTPGFLYPLRFKIETSLNSDFSDAHLVVDRMGEEEVNPGTNVPMYRFPPKTARYLRLTATELRCRDTTNYAFALTEMQVLSEGRNLAESAKVSALDSIESSAWALKNLVDGVTFTVPPGGAGEALPGSQFRKTFSLEGTVVRATAYVAALGLYDARINGNRVGNQLLAPEWTNYRKRIQYQAYDVTHLLRSGPNAIGVMVGEGWYAGRLMVFGRNAYGAYPRFLMQLEIELANGQIQRICTDDSWRGTTDGPIRSASIYDGETYDARRETTGWDTSPFDDASWQKVSAFELGPARLVWQPNEPIRVVEELKPVKMTEPQPGTYIFDLGQNMVGWCRFRLRGSAGKTVTFRHGEMLNSDGTLYTANLRGAKQMDRYICKSDTEEVYEPRFTYHGFRYVELTGLDKAPAVDSVIGRVFYSASPDAGRFESSSPMVNQLMRNIYWTQRANMMSTPNDCPQRDERFGWMGDIQAFSQTAIFNLDMAGFFSKWVRDIRDDQADDGRYPDFAPHPGDPNASFSGVPAWGDAGTIVPWRMYQNYADVRLIEEHYASAKRWVEYVHHLNPDLIWSKGRNNDYNDWLNGDTLIHTGWPRTGGAVPQEIFATAFFAHSTEIVAKMAAVLEKKEDADTYGQLFARIKNAFNERFVAEDGRIRGDTQAGYALALHFDLLPQRLQASAMENVLAGFKRYKGHLSTGIQTSHRLLLELSRNGHMDEAYRVLNLRDFPSWGMMIENGATTIWERWDGWVRDRGFQDPGMNSFNHWAFGAIGEWIWRHVAGINPDESAPGFQHFTLAPSPGGGITWANGRYDSIHGRIVSEWKIENHSFTLNVKVPPNTTATVYLPTTEKEAVIESGKPLKEAGGIAYIGTEGNRLALRVDSGRYSFITPWK